jgi:hypothetical protein
VRQRPPNPAVARPRVEHLERMTLSPRCRTLIFSMLTLKTTINAGTPESVTLRVHLRWPGTLPGRVQVNAKERFNHESDQTDAFPAPAGRRDPGTLRARSPRDRRSAIAGVAGVVWGLFPHQNARAGPAKPPGRFRPASRKDPASFPEGSRPRPPPLAPHPRPAADVRPPPCLPKPTTADPPLCGLNLWQTYA